MKDFCKLSGDDIRILVLSAMITEGVGDDELAKAKKIKFPLKPIILGTSIKVKKGEKENVLTSIVYLAPSTESVEYGGTNTCPLASLGCAGACLGTKKRLKMSYGHNSKAWKTLLWLYRPDIYKALIIRDIRNLEKRANKKGYIPAVRLNGTSDILWEIHFPEIFTLFPNVTFYDYTKIEARMYRDLPNNYSLTFSRSEDNQEAVNRVLLRGGNVAVVFTNLENAIENGYNGHEVINGDLTDYRPSDKRGVVVGLSIKSDAKDDTGFFVDNGPIPKKVRKAA